MILVRELLLHRNVVRVCRTRSVLRRYSALPPKSQSSIHDDAPPSLTSFIFENLHSNSRRPALVYRDEELSFMETWGSALRFGGGLLEHGIKPGSILATVAANTSHLVTATLGATEVGVGVATLCPISHPESLCRQLVSCQASVVLTTSDNLHKVASAARYYGKLRLVIIVQTGEEEEEDWEKRQNVGLEVETVRYVELISSPVSSWPAEADLRPYYLQYPALLNWRGDSQGDFLAFSHHNIISGVTELDTFCRTETDGPLTSLVTVPSASVHSISAILYHLWRGHRVIIDRKCPTLPLTIDYYKPSVYHLGPGAASWLLENRTVCLSSVDHLVLHSEADTDLLHGLRSKLTREARSSVLHIRPHLTAGRHVTQLHQDEIKMKLLGGEGDQRTMGVWDRGHLELYQSFDDI